MNSEKNINENGLIWITGYSGAGKTTVAQLVSANLKKLGLSVILLDGDEIRSILGERYGHDLDERRQLAFVYSRLCKKIVDSGITVVIGTVAMFEAVRIENRASNQRYFEVYLKVPQVVREERDPKGIYKAAVAKGMNSTELTIGFEEPISPDLVINNYGEMLPSEASEMIVSKYMEKLKIESTKTTELQSHHYDDLDVERKKYWDSYYKKRKAPIVPSSFALFCNQNFLTKRSHLIEFGCGNGRDAFYFAKDHSVTAIDESEVVVTANQQRAMQEGHLNIEFFTGQFGNKIQNFPEVADAIYARFVIHAMTEEAEKNALLASKRILRNGGKLLLEFRTIHDQMINKGKKVGDTERITDHYRRFIDFDKFCSELKTLGFKLEYAIEKRGLAAYGDDDPVVGRIVATI
jgi:bifunctional enzyme CysN/CysC